MDIKSLNKRMDDLAEVQSSEFRLIMGALARERDGLIRFADSLGKTKQTTDELQGTVGELQQTVNKLSDDVGKLGTDVGKLNNDLGEVKSIVDERLGSFEEVQAGIGRYFKALSDQVETMRSALPQDDFDVRQEIEKINQRLDRLENPPAA